MAVELQNFRNRIEEIKADLGSIRGDGPSVEAAFAAVRSRIETVDLELRIYQTEATNAFAESQAKQTESMIFWTRCMTVAIVLQAVAVFAQVFVMIMHK